MRVLVIGAAGKVGSTIAKYLGTKHELRGMDVVPMPMYKDSVIGGVADWDAVYNAMKGMDGVMHLAYLGHDWEPSLQSMKGTYNVYESAAKLGVKHIAFASRGGVVPSSYYPQSMTRTAETLPRPESYYSITKVFGEAMGDMYSAKHGMSIVSVRIGNMDPTREKVTHPHMLSPRDCAAVFDAAIRYDGGKHVRVYGASDSNWPLYDLDHGRKTIGYYPQDKSIVPEDQIPKAYPAPRLMEKPGRMAGLFVFLYHSVVLLLPVIYGAFDSAILRATPTLP